ncbi:uncharacterized protein [Sinocyclocheilus grahami]|uniref:uncharacterized protein n=1 Tax=Sinocyclocheilus grahami TaxID=75366 RepID=UPI0007AD43C0|nr:PREDICTED: uncharacterized protein LOC107577220 [Sinocyclocheilus grahami]
MSLKEEPESESKRKRSESPEFTSTIHEHTDLSKESDHEHKNKRTKSERAHSPAPSYRSDFSMDLPTNFKSGETFGLDLSESKKRTCELPTMKQDQVVIIHLSEEPSDEHKNIRVKSERAASPAPSYMSLRTDLSIDPPTNFKDFLLDTSIKKERETITVSTNNQMDNTFMTRSERAPSPTLSLWSDRSVEPSANWKTEEPFLSTSR